MPTFTADGEWPPASRLLRHDNVRTDRTPESDTWETPQALITRLVAEFDFTLDAAASKANRITDRYLGLDHKNPRWRDALAVDWTDEIAFLNPPFSLLRPFVLHAARQARRHGATVVAVLPMKTETWAFYRAMPAATEIRFLAGRLTYEKNGEPIADARGRPTPARFPSGVVIWTPPSHDCRERAMRPRVRWWNWKQDRYR